MRVSRKTAQLFTALAVIFLISGLNRAAAQNANMMCFNATLNTWQPCSANNPLPTTGSGGGGATSTNITGISGVAPAVGAGASNTGTLRVIPSSDASIAAPLTNTLTNPTSTLTRPTNTTNYAQGQLIASNVTAGSIVVPSFAIVNSAGGAEIQRIRLRTTATSNWGTTFTVNLWTTAPTYTNGDGGTYAVATGSAAHLCTLNITLTQYGDGAAGEAQPNVGNACGVKLASGTAISWDLQYTGSASLTPLSGQTFTVTPETLN